MVWAGCRRWDGTRGARTMLVARWTSAGKERSSEDGGERGVVLVVEVLLPTY